MPNGARLTKVLELEKIYTEHYHLERNHQGLENQLIERRSRNSPGDGPVECRERLGGMLRYYRRAA